MVRSVGSAAGAGRDRQGHSRQVLLQAHGYSAVVEGVQVGGQEDVAAFEEKLDGHNHVICGQQMGPASGGATGGGGLGLGGTGSRNWAPPAPTPPSIRAPHRRPSREREAACGDPGLSGAPQGSAGPAAAIRSRLVCRSPGLCAAGPSLCPCRHRGPWFLGVWGRAPARSQPCHRVAPTFTSEPSSAAPNAQGTGSGGASPWPGGVLGMLLGELQTTAPPCMLATCGGDSPKRHSSLSSSLRAGRGLTVRCTCGRATQLIAGLLCPASGCRQPPAPALSPSPLAILRLPSCMCTPAPWRTL